MTRKTLGADDFSTWACFSPTSMSAVAGKRVGRMASHPEILGAGSVSQWRLPLLRATRLDCLFRRKMPLSFYTQEERLMS